MNAVTPNSSARCAARGDDAPPRELSFERQLGPDAVTRVIRLARRRARRSTSAARCVELTSCPLQRRHDERVRLGRGGRRGAGGTSRRRSGGGAPPRRGSDDAPAFRHGGSVSERPGEPPGRSAVRPSYTSAGRGRATHGRCGAAGCERSRKVRRMSRPITRVRLGQGAARDVFPYGKRKERLQRRVHVESNVYAHATLR